MSFDHSDICRWSMLDIVTVVLQLSIIWSAIYSA